jgi:hypothetical protein
MKGEDQPMTRDPRDRDERPRRNKKLYTGCRGPEGYVVSVIDGNGGPKPLNNRLELRNHSPTGFEWGYGGSGPAQLPLAILADHLGDDCVALNLYQNFKWACIAQISSASWSLSSDDIDNCLARLPKQEEDPELPIGDFSQ